MAGLAVTTAVRTGDTATEILACARAHDADLIAMTTHGRSGIGGLAQKSVAHRVLHGATCPTFVVRPRLGDQTAATFRTIVVPLDGSPFAAHAIPVAQGLARRYGASVAVVEVVQDQYPTYVSDATLGFADFTIWKEANERDRAYAGEYVDVTATRLREAGLVAVGVVRDGMPVDVLATFVSRQPNPLIVTASHGRTGLSRWLLGSVAEGLVTNVSCPLIILRAAAEEGASDTANPSRRIETATAPTGAAMAASPRSSIHGPMAADTAY
jgi:nucleotide-binding universal stress UspA family protein